MRSQIGFVGLGVMGRSLALNLAGKGWRVAVYSSRKEETLAFARDPRCQGLALRYFSSLEELLQGLERPRRVWLMVKAGEATDQMIKDLLPKLGKADVLLEGGNSHYRETEERSAWAAKRGVGFLGCGVSGGEEGALKGPSLMAGGDLGAWEAMAPLLKAAAARAEGNFCAAHLGKGAAGHFVKMAHNGIEYALMQASAEAYDTMRHGLQWPRERVAEEFLNWQRGALGSYLLEVTTKVLSTDDADGSPLLEKVLDASGQKGTGAWAAQAALELGVAVPCLSAAVDARYLSSLKTVRVGLAAHRKPVKAVGPGLSPLDLRAAYALAQTCSFAQGLHLIAAASIRFGYGVRLADALQVWSGGCIIRAKELRVLRGVLLERPGLENPLHDHGIFRSALRSLPGAMRTSAWMRRAGISAPVFNAAIDYALTLSTARLPANLIQAQRDHFGAHGYQRVDQAGDFHTSW